MPILISILFLFLFSGFLHAHGIKVLVSKKPPCVVVNAQYHGSRGLAGADVTVNMETVDEIFQTGKTDKNGTFCFYPDQTGQWTIKVDDGTGHIKKHTIDIDSAFFNMPDPAPEPETETKPAPPKQEKKVTSGDLCCYLLKIVIGIVLILLITLIMQRLAKKQKKE